MVNVPPSADWAWPRLIESLQRDIYELRETVNDIRKETAIARDKHRDEVDGLIEQLRSIRTALDPIVSSRDSDMTAKQRLKWAWIERLGWVAMGGIAIALWEFIKRELRQ
jgi:hypothetical protein